MGLRTDVSSNDISNLLDSQIEQIYSKELAIASCINLIANAIASCEIQTFKGDKEVKDKEYYELNVAPNPNENGSQLWHKAIEKMITESEALIVTVGGQLHVAESYSVDAYPIKGNVYSNVSIESEGQTLQLNKIFKSEEVIVLKLPNKNVKSIIDSLASDYDEMLVLARENYKNLNQVKYKLILDVAKTEKAGFQDTFNKKVKTQLKNYIGNNNGLYVQYKGYDLQREQQAGQASSSDFIELRKDLFYTVATAFNIPPSLIVGDTTRNQNLTEVMNTFLTFCIDPIADMISKELTRKIYPGYESFARGNSIKVDTSSILHTDVLSVANAVDKLLASGTFNRNEIRKLLNLSPINDELADVYFMTKNYSTVENVAKELNEPADKGGEQEDEVLPTDQ